MEPWRRLTQHTRHLVIAHCALSPANVLLVDLEKVRLAFKERLTRLKQASGILLRAAPTLTPRYRLWPTLSPPSGHPEHNQRSGNETCDAYITEKSCPLPPLFAAGGGIEPHATSLTP